MTPVQRKRGPVRIYRPPVVARLEVHRHAFVSGPRAGGHYERDGQWHTGTFSHAHASGDVPHAHPDTGPASYTIDTDAWYRTTRMHGGGRKTFTAQPSGEQFPIVALTPEQQTFEVHCTGRVPPGWVGEGGGFATAARMVHAFKLRAVVIDARPRRRRR